jgi:tetratricopeptide (TPR) repeat protein
MVLARKDNVDGALDLLRGVAASAPELRWAQFELASTLLEKGPAEAREALAVVANLLDVFPEEISLLRLKAEAHSKLQEFDQAVEALRRVASVDEGGETLVQLGRALYDRRF